MSTDTDSLENKVEQQRARVDSTLDELRDRLSVGQIVDEVWGQLSDGQGGDAVKNIGRQVRDNPLALGLIGAGVAWLLAGEGVRAEGRDLRRRYEAWSDDPADDAGQPGLIDKAKSRASTVADSASDTAGRASDAITEAAAGVTDAARGVRESVSNTVVATGETARSYGAEASDAARYAADEAGRYGRYVRRDLYARGERLRRSFVDTLSEEPIIVGGVALAVGAAIGLSLPSTRREDVLMGSVRDDLRDTAYAYGEDVAGRFGHVAEKAYEAASEEAENKGLTPEGGSGETLAEKAGDVVKAAADKAKTEAKKEGLT
jgi:hypothetical protein